MRSYVRFLTAASTAALVLVGACGTEPTSPSSPDLSSGSLNYTITPSTTGWTKQPADPLPTNTVSVLIGGLIAVGGYPQFGAMQYSGGGNNWLEMTTVPDFSRSPLAWRFTFKLKPGAASLPIGSYTVTIPVTVPAATNNPQSIVVTYSNCGNCLFIGDERLSAMTGSSPTWNRSSTLNESGGYHYQDWRVFVPAGATAQVDMFGRNGNNPTCDPSLTLNDPYLYSFGPTPATTFVDSDDDSGCGYDSIIFLTNGTGTQQEYLVRATNFQTGLFGTYRIRVSNSGAILRGEADPTDKVTAEKKPTRR